MLTCVADPGVVDLDSDLVCLGWGDLDVLDAQLFACFPCYGRLASNGLVTLASQLFCLPASFILQVQRVSHSSPPHPDNCGAEARVRAGLFAPFLPSTPS